MIPSNLAFMRRSLLAGLAKAGTTVTLRWTVYAGGTVNAITGARTGATGTVTTTTAKAFVHFPGALSRLRQYLELEENDCIADFPPTTILDGLVGLEFVIDGRTYVQKDLAAKVTQQFDAVLAGVRMCRTVVLRLKT